LIAAVSMGVMAGGAIRWALSEDGGCSTVYQDSSCVATLLFVHVYFCVPWLFHGRFRHYWPYIIMAMPFGGFGAVSYFSVGD